MFLDASIIVAILAHENDRAEQIARIAACSGPFFYAPSVRFEVTIALARVKQGVARTALQLEQAEIMFQRFMDELPATEIDITAEIGRHALVAARTYGKVVGNKAALNFGDCFSYAAARALGVGLLYKGNDFSLTDLA